MKSIVMLAIALIVPVFFISLALSSAYHRRKARRKSQETAR